MSKCVDKLVNTIICGDYAGCELSQEYIDLGRVKAAETGVPVAKQNIGQLALFEGK